MNDYVGIDLGTTNSIVSYYNNGRCEQVKIGRNTVVPSAIFFDSKDKLYFGEDAIKRMSTHPECGIKVFKRMLRNPNETKKVMYKKVGSSNQDNFDKKYIIDTNIFITIPNIIDRLKSNEKAIVSYTVLDELKYRMTDQNTKYPAEAAIDSINKYQQINPEKLEFMESDESVLPDGTFGFTNNDKNDNKIFSIAILCENKGEEATLITDDKGLQSKLFSMNIKYIGSDEFKQLNPISISENEDFIELTGQRASSIFLNYLREETSKKLGKEIKKAVITVPANFNHVEIEATKKAGINAGFEEIRTLKEPVSAAIMYGLESNIDKNILVYDFGGGTFDVSIIKVKDNGSMEVLEVGGDTKLGGEDITQKIAEYIYEKLEDEYDLCMFTLEESELDEQQYKYNEQKIYEKAEQLKISLSEFEEQSVSLVNISKNEDEQITANFNFTREEIENEVLRSIDGKVNQIVKNCIKSADLLVDDIDIVALAGGTSSIPIFQDGIGSTLGKQPNSSQNLATIVADGACIKAESIWGDGKIDKPLIEKVVHDFGVKLANYSFDKLIGIGTTLPASVTKSYRPVAKDQQRIVIESFSRVNGSSATKTMHDGIEFLDSVTIEGIPQTKDNTLLKIEIKFEIDKEYTLNIEARVLDEYGDEIKSENLKVLRSSKLV